MISQSTIHRGQTKVAFGSPRPTGFKLTQREILDEITETAPRLRFPEAEEPIPEVVYERRGVRENLPRGFEDIGADEVFYRQIARGNFPRSLRRMLQLPVSSTHYMAKNDLVLHGIVKVNNPVFRRLRSTLSTDWLGAGRKGWMELEGYTRPLQQALCRKKWWQDLAIPHPISDTIDHRVVKAQVYLLDKRDQLIAI